MKVEIKSLDNESFEKRDCRDIIIIEIDGKKVFSVMDGEPEDSNLRRDFNDCLKIGELMEKAYLAGKNGDDFQILNSMVSSDDLW